MSADAHVTIVTHVQGTCDHLVSCTCGQKTTSRLSSRSDAERDRDAHVRTTHGTENGQRGGKRGRR
jgi:hypothetical protein